MEKHINVCSCELQALQINTFTAGGTVYCHESLAQWHKWSVYTGYTCLWRWGCIMEYCGPLWRGIPGIRAAFWAILIWCAWKAPQFMLPLCMVCMLINLGGCKGFWFLTFLVLTWKKSQFLSTAVGLPVTQHQKKPIAVTFKAKFQNIFTFINCFVSLYSIGQF